VGQSTSGSNGTNKKGMGGVKPGAKASAHPAPEPAEHSAESELLTNWILPQSRLWIRIIVFVALVGFALATSASIVSKVIWVLSMAFLLGSFRVARIHDGKFERRMVFMFVPLKLKQWPMGDFVEIETRFGDPSATGGVLAFSIFNIFFALWSALFDRLVPWLGGNFQLRLKLAGKGRVLVWQGNSEETFQENLELLERVTGLSVRRV